MPGKEPLGRRRWLAWSLLALLTFCCAFTGCGDSTQSGPTFNKAYRRAIKPHVFNYAAWEIGTFGENLKEKFTGDTSGAGDDIQSVLEYFETVSELEQLEGQSGLARARGEINRSASLENRLSVLSQSLESAKPRVEQIISGQISLILAESGIYGPYFDNWFKITFPPVSFELEPSLNLLVVSSRAKIERLRDTVIRPEITIAESEELEVRLESYGVSALVIPLGGLGATYPSFVIESSDPEFILQVVAEEWLHQYMVFRPLGFQYILELTGINKDPDIPTLNETVVGIAAEEIGSAVYRRYYAAHLPSPQNPAGNPQPVFDFNAALRRIRLQTDALLADGQIDEAERFMEEQRQILVGQGYNIRRLNQAYFAFYGSYAYEGSSVDPLGEQVRQLRQSSASLGDYLHKASGLTSRQALQDYLAKTP